MDKVVCIRYLVMDERSNLKKGMDFSLNWFLRICVIFFYNFFVRGFLERISEYSKFLGKLLIKCLIWFVGSIGWMLNNCKL